MFTGTEKFTAERAENAEKNKFILVKREGTGVQIREIESFYPKSLEKMGYALKRQAPPLCVLRGELLRPINKEVAGLQVLSYARPD